MRHKLPKRKIVTLEAFERTVNISLHIEKIPQSYFNDKKEAKGELKRSSGNDVTMKRFAKGPFFFSHTNYEPQQTDLLPCLISNDKSFIISSSSSSVTSSYVLNLQGKKLELLFVSAFPPPPFSPSSSSASQVISAPTSQEHDIQEVFF